MLKGYGAKNKQIKFIKFPQHLKANILNIPIFSRKFCHFNLFQMTPPKDNHSLSFDHDKGSLIWLIYSKTLNSTP